VHDDHRTRGVMDALLTDRAEQEAGEASMPAGSHHQEVACSDLLGHAEVFVVGDLAEVESDHGVLPMLAPVAMQAGEHAARSIVAMRRGATVQSFQYRDRGTMATIGRNAAVAQVGPLRMTGFAGWLTWLFVHLALLIGFRNRLVTMVNWAWEYVLRDRPIRIIATRDPEPRQPATTPPPPVGTPVGVDGAHGPG
jgi:NADH dehydrogenase FAD-containing subunit